MSLRLSHETKDRVERAAVSGQSVSDFAVSALARTADDILERYQTIVLGDAERDFFLALLDAEQEPSEKTKGAARCYNPLSSEGAAGKTTVWDHGRGCSGL